MDKSELVIELGVEEIPASMLEDAARQFADQLRGLLASARLSCGETVVWFTPRRVIAGIGDIAARQPDLLETITGPPKSVGFDAAGRPTRAAQAFADKNQVPVSKIRIVQTAKGEYLSVERRMRGEPTARILRRLLPEAIGKIQFPKTMHWTPDQFRFARPLRWIVALFGGRVVRFRLAGIASSDVTAGHRFLGKAKIKVSSLAGLRQALRKNSVMVDPAERLQAIASGLEREAAAAGGVLLDDPGLLRTVVNLNEAPSVIRGEFERRFLELPQEILVTVMREHQKYFSVLDGSGRLMPFFLAVINLGSDRGRIIRAGHERVLRARLADAAFFWETDRRTPLAEREQALKSVLFQEKLGSYYDKTQRVLSILPAVAWDLGRVDLVGDLEKACALAKCDLVTEMVKEFTDLQGIVGGLYARAEGFAESVWRAVYEQYQPKSASSPSPGSETGALLALADRLDTVCGCFSIGLVPSGSGDPLALRRQANGILKIMLDRRLSLSLDRLIAQSLGTYNLVPGEVAGELRAFFEGRLKFLFEEMGFAYDCIAAVLAAGSDNPLDALERLRAIEGMRQEPDFLSLASNFKRVVNIVSQAGDAEGAPDESRFTDPAEIALWRRYREVRPGVESARQNGDYASALRALASMRVVVDEFFKQVMVMAEDLEIRKNRVSLLRAVSQLFKGVADISKIVIERG